MLNSQTHFAYMILSQWDEKCITIIPWDRHISISNGLKLTCYKTQSFKSGRSEEETLNFYVYFTGKCQQWRVNPSPAKHLFTQWSRKHRPVPTSTSLVSLGRCLSGTAHGGDIPELQGAQPQPLGKKKNQTDLLRSAVVQVRARSCMGRSPLNTDTVA